MEGGGGAILIFLFSLPAKSGGGGQEDMAPLPPFANYGPGPACTNFILQNLARLVK